MQIPHTFYLFIYCNLVVTRGSGYFTCKQNMKLVTTRFKSGGLQEKMQWQLGIFGTIFDTLIFLRSLVWPVTITVSIFCTSTILTMLYRKLQKIRNFYSFFGDFWGRKSRLYRSLCDAILCPVTSDFRRSGQ